MEASRKHGSFDTRWPCTTSRARVPALPDEAEDGLDEEALTTSRRLSLVRTEPTQPSGSEQEQEKAGAHRLLAAMAARRATYE